MTGKAASDVPKLDAASVAVRIAAAALGGYAVAWTLTAALAGVMFKFFGADRVDTAIISTNLALLVFVALIIWVFAERRLWRVVALPVAASLLFGAVAWIFRL